MNIAIIGCGADGINTLKTIIEHPNFNEDVNIYIFEPKEELGVGIAYEDDSLYKLLNVDEKYMSLDPEDPDELISYLKENNIEKRIEGMLPRSIYGEYIKDKYKKYLDHKQVEIIHKEVIDINKSNKSDKGYKVSTEKGDIDKTFDVIFLAIGQSYYTDYYDLEGKKNYIHDPYPLVDKLKPGSSNNITNDSIIGVIGNGPTGVDIYRYLRKEYDLENPIYFFSKSSGFYPGEIPYDFKKDMCTIDDKWIDENIDKYGFIDLDIILDTINNDFDKYNVNHLEDIYEKYKDTDISTYKKSLEENDTDLGFAQNYLLVLAVYHARLYNCLSGLDRIKYDEKYLDIIEFVISKNPTETMEKLIKDYEKGSIKVIRNIEDIEVSKDDKFVVSSEDCEDISTDILINATGFEKNLIKATKKDKLISNLYDHGFIEPDVGDNFVRVTYPSYNLINKKYGLMDDIYLGGMWTGSTDILNNDLRSIVRSSSQRANDFMDKL